MQRLGVREDDSKVPWEGRGRSGEIPGRTTRALLGAGGRFFTKKL